MGKARLTTAGRDGRGLNGNVPVLDGRWLMGGVILLTIVFAAHRDSQNLNLRSPLGLSGWLLWSAAVSAAVLSIKSSTALLRQEDAQAGGILQSVTLLAIIVLMIVPFMASSWLLALAVALGMTFFNPVVALLDRSEWAVRGAALQALNLVASAGAAYFLLRIVVSSSSRQTWL